MESFSNNARNILSVRYQIRMLSDWVRNAHSIGFLERIRTNLMRTHLTSNNNQWHRIHLRVHNRGNRVRRTRTRRNNRHARLARCQRVPLSRMTSSLLVTREHETELGVVVNNVVNRQNSAAWDTKDVGDANIFQRTYKSLSSGHFLALRHS